MFNLTPLARQVKSLMKIQQQIAAIAANIISVDCAAYQTGSQFSLFYLKKIVYACLPFMAVLLPFLMLSVWALIRRRLGYEVTANSIRETLTMSVIVILFFILPTLMSQAFGMVNCFKLGIGSDDYYIADAMVERCWSTSHAYWVALYVVHWLAMPVTFCILI